VSWSTTMLIAVDITENIGVLRGVHTTRKGEIYG
jgi:hypothetical protein